MQVASSPAYIKRTLWYWASLYEKQLEESHDYYELNKCIVVSLLNFKIPEFKEIEDYHTVFEVKERYSNLKLTDDLEMHYVELKKMPEFKNTKDLDSLSKWALFFNDAAEEDKENIIEELEEESEEIAMAVDILKRVSADEVKRAKYDSRLKWILEKTTILNESERTKKLFHEAVQRAENAETKMKISIKNLANKLAIHEIAEIFQLTDEKVEEIINEKNQ